VSFQVRIRASDSPSWVRYWIVRRGDLLYALRITYPPGREASDAPGVQAILDSWQFQPPAPPA
jgi:hypothetical protein